jgi:hypothetical protein
MIKMIIDDDVRYDWKGRTMVRVLRFNRYLALFFVDPSK